jgi:O-Antigen ligase
MSLRASATRIREDASALLPGGLLLAVVIVWAAGGGGYESRPALDAGYDPSPWYLGAIALIGLFGAAALGIGRIRLSRSSAIACAAFTAYVAWSFASVLWARDQGSAFLGSDRALVYLATFATFAILPWRARSLLLALGLLAAGLGVLAVVTAIHVGTTIAPSSLYIDGRLASPLGYENASAALFMLTAMTATALGAQHHTPLTLRVAGLVLAAVCLQLALLTQSRGWLFTAPLVLLLMLAVLPGRLRLLLFALGPALATVAASPALLKVYSAATAGSAPPVGTRLDRVLHTSGAHATHVMLIADIVLAAVATAVVALDRRMRISPRTRRQANRLAAAAVCIAALVGVLVALLATHGDVSVRIERSWNSFASVKAGHASSSRFASLGSQRADFWRVAIAEIGSHPLNGIGQDNFANPYIRQRRTDQEPRWAHSLELRMLVHTGVVGALLFAIFLVAGIFAAFGAPRAMKLAAALALTPLIVWLVHGSIDWLWEFPALSVPALAFLGGAGALARGPAHVLPGPESSLAGSHVPTGREVNPPSGSARLRSAGRGVIAPGALALVTLGALVALGIPFIAAKQVQRALNAPAADRGVAYADLRRAADLMPFDAQIDLVAGSLALNDGYMLIARRWFAEAQRSDTADWLAPFALGLIETERGRRGPARALLFRAHALDPRELVLTKALGRIAGAHPLSFEEAQAILSSRAQARFGR